MNPSEKHISKSFDKSSITYQMRQRKLAWTAIAFVVFIILVTLMSICSSTTIEYNTVTSNQHQHWVNYPDSITLRVNDFKYYWKDDIRNWEYNEEWIVETAFNNNVDTKHVTQAMFNKRYGIHTIEYHLKHNYKQHP